MRFPDQHLDAVALQDFSRRFGSIQEMLTGYHEPGMPEVGILSNVVENGRPIGLADAGQDWHTDMSYNPTIGFLNVLFAVKVPRRDGKVLGGTCFVNTHAAYDDLPSEVKARLADATATHDFNKFWENMRRRPGSTRGPMSEEQRRKAESDRTLAMLFAHQLQPKFQYTHRWTEGDVLVWDHVGTLHSAIADYGPDEHRLMKRCQVMADRIFDPACACWRRASSQGPGNRPFVPPPENGRS